MSELKTADARAFSERAWEEDILPVLEEYIRIPNKSPGFEPGWRELGHMDRAIALVEAWCRKQPIAGLRVEVVRLENRSPVLLLEIPATQGGSSDDTLFLYGHLDKQPETVGWREGLGPWTPVREGDRLYGRGAADDGYSAFASLTAIEILQAQKIPHARCVVLIEAAEESGSTDLPAYLDHLKARIGTPSLVICLDSGCGNYEQLWSTTTLRGVAMGTLKVQVLEEGVHSGTASGIVPSSFRIVRQLLSRIEDEQTGEIRVPALHTPVPPLRREQSVLAAKVLGEEVASEFPWSGNTHAVSKDPVELLLNKTFRPALAVTAADGLPLPGNAGNVLRPFTAVRLSVRIPPGIAPATATHALRTTLEQDPPYGAKVSFEGAGAAPGWEAPPLADWLRDATEKASQTFFGKPAVYWGEGGTIPFLSVLGERFPKSQFLVTGVLGPHSNAHGPNEFLHVPTVKRITCCIAEVIAAFPRQP